MIKTKADRKEYIKADCARYPIRWFDRFIYSEVWHTVKYLRNLRKFEYAINNRDKIWNKIIYVFRYMIWRWQSWRYGIIISPNTCGKGLYISHIMGEV